MNYSVFISLSFLIYIYINTGLTQNFRYNKSSISSIVKISLCIETSNKIRMGMIFLRIQLRDNRSFKGLS